MSTPLQTAQYLLDGDVLDVQGNYDGSNSTVQFIADGDLDGRDAADLSAGTFNISADVISDGVTSYTFSMWLKPSSFPTSGYRYIITNHVHQGPKDSIFIAINSAGQIGIQHRGPANPENGAYPRDTKFFQVAGSELTIGVWSHIAITWDGTAANSSDWEASLYKDSAHMQTVVQSQQPWDSPHPLFVGYENLGGGDTYHGYQGLMANLNVWDDQVLSSAEVAQVYNDESLVSSSSNSNENTNNIGENNMAFNFNSMSMTGFIDNYRIAINDGSTWMTRQELFDQLDSAGYEYFQADINDTDGGTGMHTFRITKDMVSAAIASPEDYSGFSSWTITPNQATTSVNDPSADDSGDYNAEATYETLSSNGYVTFTDGGAAAPFMVQMDTTGALQVFYNDQSPITDDTSYNITVEWRIYNQTLGSFETWGTDSFSVTASESPQTVEFLNLTADAANAEGWSEFVPQSTGGGDVENTAAVFGNAFGPYQLPDSFTWEISFDHGELKEGDTGAMVKWVDIIPFLTDTGEAGLQVYNHDQSSVLASISIPENPSEHETIQLNYVGSSHQTEGNDSDGNALTYHEGVSDPNTTLSFVAKLPEVAGNTAQYDFAGDYPLDEMLAHYHDSGMSNRLVSRLSDTQMKTRLFSSNAAGSFPRTRDNSILPEGFISGIKTTTIAQALAGDGPTGCQLISQAEHDLLILSAESGGYAMDASDLLPEVPLTMMEDMYRSSISRLFCKDGSLYFDTLPQHSAMYARTAYPGSANLGHDNPTLIATGEAEVASTLDVGNHMYVQGSAIVDGNATIQNDLSVVRNANLSQKLDSGTAGSTADYHIAAVDYSSDIYDSAAETLSLAIRPYLPRRDGASATISFFVTPDGGAETQLGADQSVDLHMIVEVGKLYPVVFDTSAAGINYQPAIGDVITGKIVDEDGTTVTVVGHFIREDDQYSGPMFRYVTPANYIQGLANLQMGDDPALDTVQLARAVWMHSNLLATGTDAARLVSIGDDLDVGANLTQEQADKLSLLKQLVTMEAGLHIDNTSGNAELKIQRDDSADPNSRFLQHQGELDMDATGLISIHSKFDENDTPADDNPDTTPDVEILATAGSVKIVGKDGVTRSIIAQAGTADLGDGTITFSGESTMNGNLTIEVAALDADTTHDAFRLIAEDPSKVKVKAYIQTDGDSVAKGHMLFANGGGASDDAELSLTGELTVGSNLYIDGAKPNRRFHEDGLQVEFEDNIIRLSHESKYLSFEEAYTFASQDTPPAALGGIDAAQVEAAALSAAGITGVWDDLTVRQKMQSTEGSAVAIERSSGDAGEFYHPRTHLAAHTADGVHFNFPAGEGGDRGLIVMPGHSDVDSNASPDGTTSMSLVDVGGDEEDSYSALQSGRVVSNSRMIVVGPENASATGAEWVDVLRQARTFKAKEDENEQGIAGQVSLYAKILGYLNYQGQKMGMTGGPMDENTLDAILADLENGTDTVTGAAASFRDSINGQQYNGPDLFAQQLSGASAFAVVDAADTKLFLSKLSTVIGEVAPGDGSGRLHVQNQNPNSSASNLTTANVAMEVFGDPDKVVPSTMALDLAQGTQDATPDIFKIYDIVEGAADNDRLVLDSDISMSFEFTSGRAEWNETTSATLDDDEMNLHGKLSSADPGSTSKLKVTGEAIAHQPSDEAAGSREFQAHGVVGLGEATSDKSKDVTVHGPLAAEEAAELKSNIKAGFAYDVPGQGEYRTMMLDQLDLFSGAYNRLDSALGSDRQINAGAKAEFHLGNKSAGIAADMKLGRHLALEGANSEHMLVGNDIWLGEEAYKDMLKVQDKFRFQDMFLDGSTAYTLTTGGQSSPYGYTMFTSDDIVSSLVKNAEDAIERLTWREAVDAGHLADGDLADHLATAGNTEDDESPVAFVNLFKTIKSAQSAAAGSTAMTRLTGFSDIDEKIILSASYFAQPSSGYSDDEVINDPALKLRLEVYHNGLRIPDSEYDVIYDSDHPGKAIRFKRPMERRDVIHVDTKVPVTG